MGNLPLLITNIGRLVTMEPQKGRDGPLGVIEDAVLFSEGGIIKWFGEKKRWKQKVKNICELDTKGAVVTPGLIDCHTHLVHAGSRQNEFLMRSEGKSYWEIAKAGGGIMSTVRATRAASEKELFALALARSREALSYGITTLEVKSGYGLDLETELKMLRVVKSLGKESPQEFVPTFLAHIIPPFPPLQKGGEGGFEVEYRREYINLIINKMLPVVAKEKLAKFCDVFVEEGAFAKNEARAIAKSAMKLGLKMRLHVDQFKDGGGALLAAEMGAVSADHLDYVSDKGIGALKKAKVTAVLLPGAAFFTSSKRYAPARKMIDKGVRVAIATDYNPGTNPSLNLLFMGTIAASQMGMTLDEVWRAVTINAAISLGIEKERGSIARGKMADITIFAAPDEYFPLYRYSKNLISEVLIGGVVTRACGQLDYGCNTGFSATTASDFTKKHST